MKTIKLSEDKLKKIIEESVSGILSEMDWKTYMNASRKRKQQGDDRRDMLKSVMPNASFKYNKYDDKADALEKYSRQVFNKQHGKNGRNYNYEGDSYSYQGRDGKRVDSDAEFEVKSPVSRQWKDDEDGEVVVVRHYRHGKGVPSRNSGKLYDDTFDYTYHPTAYDGANERKHTLRYDEEGEHYDAYNSSVGNEVSQSKDADYNARQDRMARDMDNYYQGKSKYQKGKGWQ